MALKFSSRLKRVLKNSDLDKLDDSFLEYACFKLIKIDLIDLIKIKASLAKNFHIQPSEVDKMPMWEYELFLIKLNDLIKSDNEQQKSEMDKYDVDSYKKMADPKSMQKMTQPNISLPSMPKF